MSLPHTVLRTHIRHIIRTHPEGHLLTPIVQEHMANSLSDFTLHAVNKFIEGQKEHGGDIRDRNLSKEFNKELIDLIWYWMASSWDDSKLSGIESTHNPERKEHV